MTNDPVLQAHELEDGIYLLSGPRPISIRDQMLRAVLLIKRLVELKQVGPNHPILIVGAGAAGASAAIAAVRSSIPTTLVDQRFVPFSTTLAADTRFVDPTVYDWPLDHWTQVDFPWRYPHVDMPLKLYPSDGHTLANAWTQILESERTSHSLLKFLRPFRVTSIEREYRKILLPLRVTVSNIPGTDVEHHRFQVVLWAAGFGRENCYIRNINDEVIYEGNGFWNSDSFIQLRKVIKPTFHSPEGPKVLISGGRDGALQDFIRIVTGRNTAREIIRRLSIPPAILWKVQSVEDRVHRGLIWANDDPEYHHLHESPLIDEAHSIHESAIVDLLDSASIRRSIERLVPNNPVSVTLVHPGDHLAPYYGLNRFIALLLMEFVKRYRKPGCITHLPRSRITHIEAASTSPHVCWELDEDGNRRAAGEWSGDILVKHRCFGLDHTVSFSSTDGKHHWDDYYNLIIVRHGSPRASQISRPPVVGRVLPFLPPRPHHLWPYHLPQRL